MTADLFHFLDFRVMSPAAPTGAAYGNDIGSAPHRICKLFGSFPTSNLIPKEKHSFHFLTFLRLWAKNSNMFCCCKILNFYWFGGVRKGTEEPLLAVPASKILCSKQETQKHQIQTLF